MPTRKGWGYIAAVVAGGYLSLIEAIRFHMEQGGLSPRGPERLWGTPGPSGSAGPEDSGTARVLVEVAEHRVRLARIGELEEEVGAAILRGARPGPADFALAGENAVIRLLLGAVLEGHELDLGLEREGFEGAFLTEEVVLG